MRHKGILTVRYFFVEVLDGFKLNGKNKIKKTLKEQEDEEQVDFEQNEATSFTQNMMIRGEMEQTNSTTSSNDSRRQKNEFVEKDIDSMIRNDKRTPRIIKQIFWLVIAGILTTLAISAAILAIFETISSETGRNLEVFTVSLDRLIISS